MRVIVVDRKHEHFGLLYDRYIEKVYHKCISFVKDEALAQDLAHDIFLKTFVNMVKFNHKREFSPWLYTFTSNFCIDYTRKNSKVKYQSEEILADIPDTEDHRNEEEMMRMEAERLSHVLDQINPDEKAILLMKYQDDMSIADITEVLDISESAAKMRIKRSRAKVVEKYHKLFSNER